MRRAAVLCCACSASSRFTATAAEGERVGECPKQKSPIMGDSVAAKMTWGLVLAAVETIA